MTYRGYLEGEDISDFICASFMREPRVCIAFDETEESTTFSSDRLGIIEDFKSGEVSHENVKVVLIVVISVLLVGQICFLIWYRVRKHNEMSHTMKTTVDNAVVEYMRVNNLQKQAASTATKHSDEVVNATIE